MKERIKGLKIGEVFICLNDMLLESIKKHGLLPRKEVQSRNLSVDETDQSYLPRKYIIEGNKIVDSFKPYPCLPSREDSVFTFIFRGKLDPPTKLTKGARSTLLIHGLTGEEFVAEGGLIDQIVWRLQCIKEGVPALFAGLPGSGIPAGTRNELSEEEKKKSREKIDEIAKCYWEKLVPLDEFLACYRARGVGWGKYENWINENNTEKVFHYPEIVIPHAVNPRNVEIAVEYIYGQHLKIHNKEFV